MHWVYFAVASYVEADAWAVKAHVSPPCSMSRTPEIRHADIMDGVLFVFASDGLCYSLPSKIQTVDERNDILGLLSGSADPRLRLQCLFASNVADGLIQNVLFGSDEEKLKEVINGPSHRDDI